MIKIFKKYLLFALVIITIVGLIQSSKAREEQPEQLQLPPPPPSTSTPSPQGETIHPVMGESSVTPHQNFNQGEQPTNNAQTVTIPPAPPPPLTQAEPIAETLPALPMQTFVTPPSPTPTTPPAPAASAPSISTTTPEGATAESISTHQDEIMSLPMASSDVIPTQNHESEIPPALPTTLTQQQQLPTHLQEMSWPTPEELENMPPPDEAFLEELEQIIAQQGNQEELDFATILNAALKHQKTQKNSPQEPPLLHHRPTIAEPQGRVEKEVDTRALGEEGLRRIEDAKIPLIDLLKSSSLTDKGDVINRAHKATEALKALTTYLQETR